MVQAGFGQEGHDAAPGAVLRKGTIFRASATSAMLAAMKRAVIGVPS